MSYEQAMSHAGNHRKDRFYQQCSGYFGDGEPKNCLIPEDVLAENSANSMAKILESVSKFPVYLHQQKTGEWELVSRNHLFGREVGSREELEQFASDYA